MISTTHIMLALGATPAPNSSGKPKRNDKEEAVLAAVRGGACVSYQIAEVAGVSESYTKQILRRLLEEELITRKVAGNGVDLGKKHIYSIKI